MASDQDRCINVDPHSTRCQLLTHDDDQHCAMIRQELSPARYARRPSYIDYRTWGEPWTGPTPGQGHYGGRQRSADRAYSGGELLFYLVGVKYVYECVVMSVREGFTFESDEPLARGDVFMHAGHVYEVMESPQLGSPSSESACACSSRPRPNLKAAHSHPSKPPASDHRYRRRRHWADSRHPSTPRTRHRCIRHRSAPIDLDRGGIEGKRST
jgi:hypothetical protein